MAHSIETAYRAMTPRSQQLMDRARHSMPGGNTRSFGWCEPYPPVFASGEGPYLNDVDGNRYVDLVYNGLSLIHGHAYPPVEAAVEAALGKGTAWPGSSTVQIEFAETLCARLPTAAGVRFTNTGTEATMLAVKLARHVTGRPAILKAWDAYHGSYDDLEAGLHGIGEIGGRAYLARFGDLDSFASRLSEHGAEIAAVVIEPVLYTGAVVPPPDGFLPELVRLARDAGALVVLDDCLMFRLAEGGSAQKYGFEADITCLGKWIGGGLPVGAVAARAELMSVFDPLSDNRLYHGGSFNGNPLGCAAGKVTVDHLTAERIAEMDARAQTLATALRAAADGFGLALEISGAGSAMGIYLRDDRGQRDRAAGALLHLAAMTEGVYFGPDGELSMATVLDEEALCAARSGLTAALERVAEARR